MKKGITIRANQRSRVWRSGLAALLWVGVFATLPLRAENVPPSPQNTTVEVGFDRRGIPAKIDIWRDVSVGYNPDGCANNIACRGNYSANTLVCLSSDNPQHGACPTMPVFNVASSERYSLTLDFTHSSNQKATLTLNTSKWSSEVGRSWAAGLSTRTSYSGVNASIPASSLSQLTLPGQWTAHLKMQVMTWEGCSSTTEGCPGIPLVNWDATIILNVSDTGTQQIFFPAFKYAAPQIDLNLSNRPGASNATMVDGSNTLDMCLYDGSNSTRNRISLLFQDEGNSTEGRSTGLFSIYREGADKAQASNRIDYQVNVLNPTTGGNQTVINGTEIIWTETNRRNIQREVVIPGLPGPLFCVPAPLTFITPSFRLVDKNAGHYTGTLRVIYTPTTQTG